MIAPASTRLWRLCAAVPLVFAAACADQPVAPGTAPVAPRPLTTTLAALECQVDVVARTASCASAAPEGDARLAQIGGQGTFVQLANTEPRYEGDTVSFEVTVQNLMNEAIGTRDGVTPDPAGIMVYFHQAPREVGGTGSVAVDNPTGKAFFTAAGQPYFTWNEVLQKDQVSAPMTWRFVRDPEVARFRFRVYLETEVEYRLVINEVLVNPGGTVTDASGEWFELYNAGSRAVELQNLLIADSAASGRRPYHLIASSMVVQPGGYVVLGNSTNTTDNGGVPVDYAYGSALTLANSLDAIKIARLGAAAGDTLTIDRTQFASAATSAQNGVSRELKNPALDNSNLDGSNWADASVTAVYGPGGRGTPKAQNSIYTP